ncbi:AzlD domain-containing protein [Pelagibacterium lacus]|uniref:AzlD domain-containing protein n=1 Tax=Pelagibacterium lacus TaxID=2282655 RepID=A0A369W5S2_9HYPH|nr:AzlD domain-containing protein [Pelagibacterium lacus]RDE09369.1 hypothetical protein DVH29_06070 [Pelagibacterium lacus]
MNSEFWTITILVAIGTYLIRFLPTFLMRGTGNPDSPLSRFLAATGPAAIAALFVGALLPRIAPDWPVIAPLAAGALAVVAVYWWRREVTIATLAGAVAYGVVFALV